MQPLAVDWPAPLGVRALCTTRAGGTSLPPYGSLNLGTHVGDDPAAVLANRQRLQAALGGAHPVFLSQVHSDGVAHLHRQTPDGTEADACVTTDAGVVCTIMVADCLPVLLAHQSGAVVAAAHAGWRGLAGQNGQGVLDSVFNSFQAVALKKQAHFATKNIAKDSLVWLGPCIGPQAFEVGAEVRSAFCDANPAAAVCFSANGATGKYLCDLAGLARLKLDALGVTKVYGNDSTASWCTVSNASRFFSHRRDSAALGGSGRFAACIWRI